MPSSVAVVFDFDEGFPGMYPGSDRVLLVDVIHTLLFILCCLRAVRCEQVFL
jgi:hypothetical protein